MIILRYLAKEVYATISAVAGLLVLTFLANAFIRYLTRAAAGKMSALTVLKIILLQAPNLLGLLLPVSLFISFLLTYGRLYAENEMTALISCGMSQRQLLSKSLLIASIIIILDAFLVFWISPSLSAYQSKLLAVSPELTLLETLQPGRFQVMQNGKLVFYIEKMNPHSNRISHIFIAQQANDSENPPWNVLSAASGFVYTNPKTQAEYVVAQDGYRYMGQAGSKAFKILAFKAYGAKIDTSPQAMTEKEDALPTKTLWKERHQPRAMAALQWRLSAPFSIPLLTSLAIPLARVQPRQGRYAKLLPGILVYAIYANLMFVSRDWLAHSKISPAIGMWWLHIGLALISSLYWWFSSNRSWRLLKRKQ